MAKKDVKDRQARLEEIRRAQRAQQRRTTLLISAAVAALVVVLVGAVVVGIVREKAASDLSAVGVSAAAAACDAPLTDPASGGNIHVGPGTDNPDREVDYATVPPSSGEHYTEAVQPALAFYTEKNRPPLESLVHNLEHGYTILWYLPAVSPAQVEQLERISELARRHQATGGKFIVAAWDTARGSFPAGKSIGLSHWGAKSGYRQFCAQVSGEAVKTFISTYPYTDSPEPNA